MKIHIPDSPELNALRAEADQLLAPWRGYAGIAAMRVTLTERRAASDAYALVRSRTDAGPEFTVEASSTAGAAAGFHHLLRLMGFGFSFFADAIPEQPGSVEWPFDADRVEANINLKAWQAWRRFSIQSAEILLADPAQK